MYENKITNCISFIDRKERRQTGKRNHQFFPSFAQVYKEEMLQVTYGLIFFSEL